MPSASSARASTAPSVAARAQSAYAVGDVPDVGRTSQLRRSRAGIQGREVGERAAQDEVVGVSIGGVEDLADEPDGDLTSAARHAEGCRRGPARSA